MANLKDYMKDDLVFPTAEKLNKEQWLGFDSRGKLIEGRTLALKGACLKHGQKGNFFVILATKEDGKEVSFLGGVALDKWIKAIAEGQKINYVVDVPFFFTEDVYVLLDEKKSRTSSNNYFDFQNP